MEPSLAQLVEGQGLGIVVVEGQVLGLVVVEGHGLCLVVAEGQGQGGGVQGLT